MSIIARSNQKMAAYLPTFDAIECSLRYWLAGPMKSGLSAGSYLRGFRPAGQLPLTPPGPKCSKNADQ